MRAVGHRRLMLEPRLRHLEGADHAQEHLPALDGLHPAGGEVLAVPDAVHLVDDGTRHVARPQEVGVQRVRQPGLHRPARGDQRLADDLAPEHRLPAEVARRPAEEVDLQRLEVEQAERIVQGGTRVGHGHLRRPP